MSKTAQVQDVLKTLGNWKASTQYMCDLPPVDFAMEDRKPHVARSYTLREAKIWDFM